MATRSSLSELEHEKYEVSWGDIYPDGCIIYSSENSEEVRKYFEKKYRRKYPNYEVSFNGNKITIKKRNENAAESVCFYEHKKMRKTRIVLYLLFSLNIKA